MQHRCCQVQLPQWHGYCAQACVGTVEIAGPVVPGSLVALGHWALAAFCSSLLSPREDPGNLSKWQDLPALSREKQPAKQCTAVSSCSPVHSTGTVCLQFSHCCVDAHAHLHPRTLSLTHTHILTLAPVLTTSMFQNLKFLLFSFYFSNYCLHSTLYCISFRCTI